MGETVQISRAPTPPNRSMLKPTFVRHMAPQPDHRSRSYHLRALRLRYERKARRLRPQRVPKPPSGPRGVCTGEHVRKRQRRSGEGGHAGVRTCPTRACHHPMPAPAQPTKPSERLPPYFPLSTPHPTVSVRHSGRVAAPRARRRRHGRGDHGGGGGGGWRR